MDDLALLSGDEEEEQVTPMTEEEKAAELIEACKLGDADRVQALFDDGATASCRDPSGWSPLVWAAFHGHDEIVAILLQHGAETDYRKSREEDEAKILEAHATSAQRNEPPPRVTVNSPLHWAAFKGHLHVVWRLLLAGFSVSEVDANGNNAMHLAAAGGRPEVIKTLMCQGFDVDAVNGFGNNARCLATTGAARGLLMKAEAQKQCPMSRKYFGGDVKRFMCACSELFYVEECTVAEQIHASIDSDIVRPVRYSSQSQERIQEAQDRLHEAMHPTADDEDGSMVAEEKGDDEERAGEDPEAKPPAREIPLTREHLKPLQAAIRDVRRIGGDIRLIAAAEKAEYGLRVQMRLEDELESLEKQRPIKRRTQSRALVAVTKEAEEAEVEASLIDRARTLVRLAVAECKLRGAVTVCRNIALATHSHDGDMKKLKDSYDVCATLGANPDLVEAGRALYAKLEMEVKLFDQVNAVKAARDEVTSVVEACIAETEAPDYEFPLLRPEPIEGPDGEMVPPPTRQMKALNSLKTNLDTLHELVEGAPSTGASDELTKSSDEAWAEGVEEWKAKVEVEEERAAAEEVARVKLEKKLRKKNKKKKKKKK